MAEEDKSNKTFLFNNEDHTLGNVVRYMLMRDPAVEFAGYSVPHPSEPVMNIRVQCVNGESAETAMADALENIIGVCNHVGKVYNKKVEEFKKSPQDDQMDDI
eukprot:GEMP01076970.1.p2 GENE.GEMP01076970.1~~GEMP01076970.1.p2  ORF type:complete len:103 (+),score=30.68 GEMP01076970.1:94-402(+)